MAISARKLEIIDGSEFYSLIRPSNPDTVEKGALEVNKLKMEDLLLAQDVKSVWTNFTQYCSKYTTGSSIWNKPIPCGYNISKFDMPIVNRLCQDFGPVNKSGDQGIFHVRDCIDILHDVMRFTENNPDIKSISLDSVREWMGISRDGAHNALTDAKQTAELVIRFLNLYRYMAPKVKFRQAFSINT